MYSKSASQGFGAFLLLWVTQSFSELGSAMTNFALVVWSYQQHGSALTTALLTVCSYAPYVLLSIFAGAWSDRWNQKVTMLAADCFAALCTILILILLQTGSLEIWHLYALNALNGLMNTVQQPASDVAVSLLAPRQLYQRVGGLRAFSNALITVLTPALATALLSFTSLQVVIAVDLFSFSVAFLALLLFIHIPRVPKSEPTGSVFALVRGGLRYLAQHRGILDLILFLALINLTASMFNAALPAMLLPRRGEMALGLVNTCTGLATLAGSLLVSLAPAPKSRVRVILNSLLFAMSTENFLLAFGRSTPVWCAAAVLGWLFIPVMNANLDALFRLNIPIEIQGRVYAARNTLQFFTIPLGYFIGGLLVDRVFEPLLARQPPGSFLVTLFGSGKGAGAACLFFLLGLFGLFSCLPFRRDRHIWSLEQSSAPQ